ncbi:hypothetical protein AB0L57_00490 [Nocardia sp. NPDC052254]|uniref:Rv1733c family protein n=1 Tax=Nocardia sp. NPDC052254 TaxID=3155681 RepID=UPI0034395552
MAAGYPSLPVRAWRRGPWTANPLMRVSDRIEAIVGILAVLVLLAAVPVSAAIGTAHYTDAADRIRAADAAKTQVSATVVDDPIRSATIGMEVSAQRTDATVRWVHDGHAGTATAPVPDSAHRGEQTTVWLRPDGHLTEPPLPADTAAVRGIGAAVVAFVEIGAGTAALVVATMWLCEIRRRAVLAREWRMVCRPIETQ